MTTESDTPEKPKRKPRTPKEPIQEQPEYMEQVTHAEMILTKAIEVVTSFCSGINQMAEGEEWQAKPLDEDLPVELAAARQRCVIAAFEILTNQFNQGLK